MSRLYTVSQYLSGIGLFSALLYFVGRRYLEQYFGIMSMPLEVMNLNFADYAYYGAQPIPLIITGLFTILGLKLWVLAFQKRTLPETTILKDSYGTSKKDNRIRLKKIFRNFLKEAQIFIKGIKNRDTFNKWSETFMFIYLVYTFCLVGSSLVYIVVLGRISPPSNFMDVNVYSYISILMVFIFVSFGLFFFSDKKFTFLLDTHKKVRNVFLVFSVVSLALFPTFSSGSYGTFTTINDLRKSELAFKSVTLVSMDKIDNIQNWEVTDDKNYVSKNNLLIYEADGYLYLKHKSDIANTVVISKTSIISYFIQNPAISSSDFGNKRPQPSEIQLSGD